MTMMGAHRFLRFNPPMTSNNKKQFAGSPADRALGFLAVTVMMSIVGFGTAGWVTNIICLTAATGETPVGMTIARVVGIPIVPVGSVLGYFPN